MTQFSSLYGTRLDEELGTDDSTILFTTTRRKSAINRGLKEFANLTECLQRSVQVSVTGGVSEYDVNSTTTIPAGDFNSWSKEPIEYFYTDGASSQTWTLSGDDSLPRRDLRWLDTYQPGWRQSTIASTTMQLPSLHYVRREGGQLLIGFWPFLGVTDSNSSAAASSASFRLPYLPNVPSLVNDTDQPYTFNGEEASDLDQYHQAAVHYAAHQLEKLRRDDQASDRQLQKFMGYVSRYLQSMRVKGGRAIMQARRYFHQRIGGWTDPRSRDPKTGLWS